MTEVHSQKGNDDLISKAKSVRTNEQKDNDESLNGDEFDDVEIPTDIQLASAKGQDLAG